VNRFGLIVPPLLVGLAAQAVANADYKAVALSGYPIEHATAETVFFHDCNEPDHSGLVVCHTCGNELKVSALGGVQAYAGYNEQILSPSADTVRVLKMSELGRHLTELQPQIGSLEQDKGAESFRKFLVTVFDEGNAWCARFGGERHDLKNAIGDASRGKYVEWK
jgi:hypothetical protein